MCFEFALNPRFQKYPYFFIWDQKNGQKNGQNSTLIGEPSGSAKETVQSSHISEAIKIF